MNKLFLFGNFSLLFVVLLISCVKCANILGLMPVASPSHHIWNSAIMHKLAERGHNVTILSTDLPKNFNKTLKNVHYIHLEEVYNTIFNISNVEFEKNGFIGLNPYSEILMYYDFATLINKGVVNSKGFQKLLNYPENFRFDLIIYDFTFGGVLIGFLHKFKYPPLVGVSAFPIPPILIEYVGGHFYPSYIPFHSLYYDINMNYLERIHNTFLFVADIIFRRIFYIPATNALIRDTYLQNDIPDLSDLEQFMTIALVNSHPSINYPHPLPPNIIEVGGLQIKEPNILEKEIENFVNLSKKGIIYFSFGTNVHPNDIGFENTDTILNVMQKYTDYHFLWKFDINFVKRKIPFNVMIRKFFSQNDILAHSKLKLFITHAGALSTQEAIWYGVPMIGIPLFADQHRNIHKSVLAGIAIKLDYKTLNVENLKNAISEILLNKTYKDNIKILSERFRDRNMKPLDTAIWWIKYILRHPNADHLKSPTIHLGIFISNSFDVVIFFLIILGFIIFIGFKIFKILFLCKKQCTKNQSTDDKKFN